VLKGGRAARCRSRMEAEKERVASRVPTGLHAHLYTLEKSSPNRAGPGMGLTDWAALERWNKGGRASTLDATGSLTRGARTCSELCGRHSSTSPRTTADGSLTRSGADGEGAPRVAGDEDEDDAGTSKTQPPTCSLNEEGSGDSQTREQTLAPESGGKSEGERRGP
jgi:hypothetical protein